MSRRLFLAAFIAASIVCFLLAHAVLTHDAHRQIDRELERNRRLEVQLR